MNEQEPVLEHRLRNGEADVQLAYFTRLQFVIQMTQDRDMFEDALLSPMNATFALRRSDSALRDAIDKALDAMSKDGSLKQIKARHLRP